MTYGIIQLILFLAVIVAASELFTNAIESIGEKFGFSEGVTGSVFAAVGTALPETMVPIVAIFAGGAGEINEEVGVGAILGAPFMLSTLAAFVLGIAAWRYRAQRGKDTITPEKTGLRRDMEFFLFTFTLAFAVAFTPHEYRTLRVFVALVLVFTYFYYVMETIKASASLVRDGHAVEKTKGLYLSLIFREHMFFAVAQLLFALALIIAGAKGFVGGVKHLAAALHLPVIALSLLVIPVATELPEKINSIIWIKNRKDTMAVGNITGAMVFQGSLLPAIGIFLTPWTVNPTVISSSLVTIMASVWLYAISVKLKAIKPFHLIVNGVLYLAFVAYVLTTVYGEVPF